jgi:CDP-diacylglycerol--glycerol-3-phosphate 3-phosphatidyltransferase
MTPRQGEWSLVGEATRDRVRASVIPLARALSAAGFSADALTVAGLFVSLGAAVLAFSGAWLAAGVVIVAGSLFDLFDGAVARVRGTVSPFGGFLDSTFDRLAEAAVYAGLVAGLLGPGALGVTFPNFADRTPAQTVAVLAALAMGASLLVSYTRARAQGMGLDAAVGVAPRPERIALLAAGLILQPFTGWSLGVALSLIVILSLVTIGQRVRHVRRLTRPTERPTVAPTS